MRAKTSYSNVVRPANSSALRTGPELSAGRIRLKTHVAVTRDGDALLLFDDRDIIRIPDGGHFQPIFDRLKEGVTWEALRANCDTGRLASVFREIASIGWFSNRPSIGENSDDILACNSGVLDAWASSEAGIARNRLSSAIVTVVGVGGIGSEIALHLATAGVGQLTLVDGDTVAVANLNRQYAFRRSDVGRLKVAVMQERLADLRPRLRVEAIPQYLHAFKDLSTLGATDFAVQAADDPSLPLDRWLASWADGNAAGFTMASVGINVGYWGPSTAPGDSRSASGLVENLKKTDPSAPKHITPWSLGATNSAIAALAARDIVALLVGSSEVPSLGSRVRLAFATGQVTTLTLDGDDSLA